MAATSRLSATLRPSPIACKLPTTKKFLAEPRESRVLSHSSSSTLYGCGTCTKRIPAFPRPSAQLTSPLPSTQSMFSGSANFHFNIWPMTRGRSDFNRHAALTQVREHDGFDLVAVGENCRKADGMTIIAPALTQHEPLCGTKAAQGTFRGKRLRQDEVRACLKGSCHRGRLGDGENDGVARCRHVAQRSHEIEGARKVGVDDDGFIVLSGEALAAAERRAALIGVQSHFRQKWP